MPYPNNGSFNQANSPQITVHITDNSSGTGHQTMNFNPGATLRDLFNQRYGGSSSSNYALSVLTSGGARVGGSLQGTEWTWDPNYQLQDGDRVTVSPAKFKAA